MFQIEQQKWLLQCVTDLNIIESESEYTKRLLFVGIFEAEVGKQSLVVIK